MPAQKETLVVNLPREDRETPDHTVARFNKRVAEILNIYGEVRLIKDGHHVHTIYSSAKCVRHGNNVIPDRT